MCVKFLVFILLAPCDWESNELYSTASFTLCQFANLEEVTCEMTEDTQKK